MDRLHRGNHPLLGKQGSITESQVLGVLNTKPVVTVAICERREDSQYFGIGPVADGVDVDLPVVFS